MLPGRVPERVGTYRLIKLLGTGKVCELWEVERGADHGRWAMKIIWPGEKYSRENLASLRHEYAVGSRLEHENVIRTKEILVGTDAAYLILELFRAPNLKQMVLAGVAEFANRLPQILQGAATALVYFHEQGWIHRDVKPDNFLVDAESRVKLIDFNIARRRGGFLQRLLNKKSKVQGTQSYMSPEQIRGQLTDERSDVYSFGCMCFELVSGKPPFTGVNTNELLGKHLRSKPPSLLASEPSATEEFNRLVQQMLAKDPDARPANMQEVLNQLNELSIFRASRQQSR